MRKGNDLNGLTIYSRNKGKIIDTVNDVIFDHTDNLILGFVINNGGWFSDAKVIPWSHVETIGPDGIIVSTEDAVFESPEKPKIDSVLNDGNVLEGTEVMTTDGKNLGRITDFYFEPTSGIIEGYEVSGGIFADAYTGRSFMPAPSVFNIGEDVAFVPPITATYMEAQVGGIKGQLNTVGGSVNSVVESTKTTLLDAKGTISENVSAAATTTSEKVSELTDSAAVQLESLKQSGSEALESSKVAVQDTLAGTQDGLKQSLASTTVERAKGYRVSHPVFADDSKFIYVAETGQIVTESDIERAKTFSKEAELLEATGLTVTDAVGVTLKDSASTVADGTSTAAGSAWESVKGAADTLKERVLDVKSSAEDMVETKRIEGSLGLPVDRVILDKNDNVILEKGEVVTHEAINSARQAGVLNVLFIAVKTPESNGTPAQPYTATA